MLPRFDVCAALSFAEAVSQFDKRVHVSLIEFIVLQAAETYDPSL